MLNIPVGIVQQQPFIKCTVLTILKMIQQSDGDYLFSLYITLIYLFSFGYIANYTLTKCDLYCIFFVLFN